MIVVTPLKRVLFFILSDIILSLGTLYLAYNLRFNFDIGNQYLNNFFLVFFVLLALKILAIAYFKMYHISWRFVSLFEVKKLFYAHVVAYGIICIDFLYLP